MKVWKEFIENPVDYGEQELAALHKLDIVAYGYIELFERVGPHRENRLIGAMRAEGKGRHGCKRLRILEEHAKKLPKNGRPRMNAELYLEQTIWKPSMNEFFRKALNTLGEPSDVVPVDESVIGAYEGKLPAGLLDVWREVGWGSFLDGYIWLCNPGLFEGVVAEIFEGDPEFHAPGFTIFMYDAFGGLYGWRNDTHLVTLEIADVGPSFRFSASQKRPGNPEQWDQDQLVAHIIGNKREEREYFSQADVDDFDYATENLGRLEPGEIYGYVPLPALGGSAEPETLRRVQAREHLLIASQVARPVYERYVLDESAPDHPMGRLEPVRLIGSQDETQ
jgi:hypothetical protein